MPSFLSRFGQEKLLPVSLALGFCIITVLQGEITDKSGRKVMGMLFFRRKSRLQRLWDWFLSIFAGLRRWLLK